MITNQIAATRIKCNTIKTPSAIAGECVATISAHAITVGVSRANAIRSNTVLSNPGVNGYAVTAGTSNI